MEQAALFARSQNRDRAGRAGGAQIGAFEGIDGNVHGGKIKSADVLRGADSFADEEHGGFVALALADDDGAVHGHFVHHLAHGFDGCLIGLVPVAKPHGLCRFDGRLVRRRAKIPDSVRFPSHLPGIENFGSCARQDAGHARGTADMSPILNQPELRT